MGIIIGILVVAAVSTFGDYLWFSLGIDHVMTAGILHGAALLTSVGGVLGAHAGRFAAGLPLGTAAGVGAALAYYALQPVIGSGPAMLAAWAALWLVLAILDGKVLRKGTGAEGWNLRRGLLAALLGAAVFYVTVETLWGRPSGGERAYWRQFMAWAATWAPGILALTLGRPRRR